MAAVLEVITEALVAIKAFAVGETPGDSDIADAFIKFNDVLESLSLQNLAIYSSSTVQIPLLAGVARVALGPGGVGQRPISFNSIDSMWVTYEGTDFPVGVATQDTYNYLTVKDTGGIPRMAAYENGFPDAVLSLYPFPEQNCVLNISQRALFAPVALTDTFLTPPGYRRLVRLMLAWELVSDYPGLAPDEVAKLEKDKNLALGAVKRSNTEPAILRSEVADMTVGGGGGWGDWREGT